MHTQDPETLPETNRIPKRLFRRYPMLFLLPLLTALSFAAVVLTLVLHATQVRTILAAIAALGFTFATAIYTPKVFIRIRTVRGARVKRRRRRQEVKKKE